MQYELLTLIFIFFYDESISSCDISMVEIKKGLILHVGNKSE